MQNNVSKALLRKQFAAIESPLKPAWIKVKIQQDNIKDVKETISTNKVVTVCEEAMCPNISDCWAKSHATFMILGDICTRSCSFCNISTGKPNNVDIFDRGTHLKKISLDDSYPKYIIDNQDKFSKWII